MAGAALHITEIAAANASGLTDEDGAHEDWIEIHNSGPGPVDLRGWHLTDDPLRVTRWEFPALVLEEGQFVVVFASGKDRSSTGAELHTDFSLAAEGEYLALTDPDGQEADEFAPAFPPQVANVSWGVVPGQVQGTHAWFYEPTPGTVNITTSRASAPPVISPGSRTFTASTSGSSSSPTPVVTMTSPQQGAEIFYTIDGSQPTIHSTPYTGALIISGTTRVRAIATAPGLLPSLVSGTTYFEVAADAVPANSNLPLMILDNFGSGRPDNGSPAVWMVFAPEGELAQAQLMNLPSFTSPAFIKVRGSSTAPANKYSLAVESRNEADGDRDFPLLGLPDDSDWVLNAPYEYDRALIRNPLMYALSNAAGRYAPRTRQVELYLNTNGGAITAADYFGVYTLTEKIKRSRDRVKVAEIGSLDNSGARVTGGYLLKVDRPDPGETGFTAGGQTMYYVDPDEPNITSAQRTWLAFYINSWRTALNAPDFFDPVNGYAKWGDPASFVDHHLLNTAAKNVDALRLSAYFYKDRLGRLCAGPLWDFDRCMDSTDVRDNNFNTWRGETSDLGTDFFRYTWYNEMFSDGNFWQSWIDRLEELRRGPLSTASVQALVDAQAAELSEAAIRNFVRWSDRPARFGGWEGEVAHLRTWLPNRLAWMDAQFTRPPEANSGGGPVPQYFNLDLTSPSLTRPGAVIYYTTDGSDPRLFDTTTGQQVLTDTFVSLTHPVKVHLPVADSGTGWRDGGFFDDSAWWSGTQGVGYDDVADYDPYIGFNLESPPPERRMKGVTQSCYLRYKFTATAQQIAPLTFLKMRVRCDDGLVAWLNGTKLPFSIKEPATLQWNSGATSNTTDSTAVQLTEFIIPNPRAMLRDGENVLAIQGLNYLTSSSDFLIQIELQGGYVPPDGPEISPQATAFDEPLTVTQTTHLVARTYDPAGPFNPWPYTGAGSGQTPVGSHWSAPLHLSLLVGTVPASAANLTLTEIMYHPAKLSAAEKAAGFTDREDFEYLVLRNTSPQHVDLTGIRFTTGIEFTMPLGPKCVLAPGQSGVIARNAAALAHRSVPGLKVLGEYRDKLSNAGETLTLLAANGDIIFSATWDDGPGWPQSADGDGYSLVHSGPGGELSLPSTWRRSVDLHGESHAPAALGFNAWQALYFPAGGSLSGPDDDADGDGLSNAAEYAAATHPGAAGDAAPPVMQTFQGSGRECLRISLRHRPGSPPWLLECSTDFADWQPVGNVPVLSPNDDGTETSTWHMTRGKARACYRARAVLQ
jgi:hypothetical protein